MTNRMNPIWGTTAVIAAFVAAAALIIPLPIPRMRDNKSTPSPAMRQAPKNKLVQPNPVEPALPPANKADTIKTLTEEAQKWFEHAKMSLTENPEAPGHMHPSYCFGQAVSTLEILRTLNPSLGLEVFRPPAGQDPVQYFKNTAKECGYEFKGLETFLVRPNSRPALERKQAQPQPGF